MTTEMTALDRLISRLQLSGDPNPNTFILEECLENAKHIILTRRFPYGDYPEEVEPRYKDLQYRIALDLYNKTGAEGETAHSENGVSRTYESSWVSEQLLNEIVPKVRGLK